MKKLTIVLLALLLIGGMAFADITLTGTADFGFELDLQSGDFGFVDSQDTGDAEFSFTLESADASAMGDADIYAVIEMSGSIDVNIDGLSDGVDDDADADADDIDTVLEEADEIATSVSIDTAKIVGEDWSVSILGMPDSMSYAESFELDGDDDPIDTVSGGLTVANGGVEIVYGDYTLGADFYSGDFDDDTVDDGTVYAVYAAGTVEVADGVAVDVAAGFDGAFDASAKVAYDMDGTTVTVAVDTDNNFGDIDASLATSLDMDGTVVGVNAYYDGTVDLELSADLDTVAVTVTGLDLIATQDISAELAFDATDSIALTVDGGYNVGATTWSAGAEVVYTADDFTATIDGGTTNANVIDLAVTLENDTMIDGATLSLGYATEDMLADTGVISAMVSISL